jgi:hypothetical protein
MSQHIRQSSDRHSDTENSIFLITPIAMDGLSMDQDFVQAPEHRPKAAIAEAVGIPVIDLSPLALAAGDQAGVER